MATELIQAAIHSSYPGISVKNTDKGTALYGVFPVEHGGRVITRFQVELVFPDLKSGLVRILPVVRETGGRIPYEETRHIQENGNCCLYTEEVFYIQFVNKEIVSFLKGPVLSFFYGQFLIENGYDWPFGQYDHREKGILEYYQEVLGNVSTKAILSAIQLLANKPHFDPTWKCWCGSGRQMRQCSNHYPLILQLKVCRIPRDVFIRSYAALSKLSE